MELSGRSLNTTSLSRDSSNVDSIRNSPEGVYFSPASPRITSDLEIVVTLHMQGEESYSVRKSNLGIKPAYQRQRFSDLPELSKSKKNEITPIFGDDQKLISCKLSDSQVIEFRNLPNELVIEVESFRQYSGIKYRTNQTVFQSPNLNCKVEKAEIFGLSNKDYKTKLIREDQKFALNKFVPSALRVAALFILVAVSVLAVTPLSVSPVTTNTGDFEDYALLWPETQPKLQQEILFFSSSDLGKLRLGTVTAIEGENLLVSENELIVSIPLENVIGKVLIQFP